MAATAGWNSTIVRVAQRAVGWVRRSSALVQDALLVAVVLTVQVIGLASASAPTDGPGRPVDVGAVALVVAGTAALLVRRTRPLAALAVSTASILAFAALDYAAPYVGYAVVAAVYSVVVYRGVIVGIAAAIVTLLTLYLAYVISASGLSVATALVDALIVATGVALGDGTRNRNAAAAAERARRAQIVAEQDRRARDAVATERAHIARELHDLVAHSISVIAVQAGMGHHLIDLDPAKAKDALATIERASRESLVEMRRMLGILRTNTDTSTGAGSDNDAADFAPQPGLQQLPALVDEVRAAGITVAFRVDGHPGDIDHGVDLSAYRIVQEALTNVLKHAGNAAVDLTVRYAADGVHIVVDDDGRGAATGRSPGYGLVGMRERAAVVGGHVTAAPRPGGGFRVSAHLPHQGHRP